MILNWAWSADQTKQLVVASCVRLQAQNTENETSVRLQAQNTENETSVRLQAQNTENEMRGTTANPNNHRFI